jgi:leucyl-tRNA synthetase
MVVQINGKKKIVIAVDKGMEQMEIEELVKKNSVIAINKFLLGKEVSKIIFVKNKLINFVI